MTLNLTANDTGSRPTLRAGRILLASLDALSHTPSLGAPKRLCVGAARTDFVLRGTQTSMRNRTRIARAAAVAVVLVSLAAGASTAGASDKAGFPGLHKRLTGQSKLLVAFTTEFRADAEQYNKLAAAAGYDYAALWATQAAAVKPL